MSIFTVLSWPFRQLAKLFSTKEGQAALSKILGMSEAAQEIIKTTWRLDAGTATVQDVLNLYEEFKVAPYEFYNNRKSIGAALINLAVELLRKKYPGTQTNILMSAAQLAYSAYALTRK